MGSLYVLFFVLFFLLVILVFFHFVSFSWSWFQGFYRPFLLYILSLRLCQFIAMHFSFFLMPLRRVRYLEVHGHDSAYRMQSLVLTWGLGPGPGRFTTIWGDSNLWPLRHFAVHLRTAPSHQDSNAGDF